MPNPLYVIFNDDWSFNRVEDSVNFTSVTGYQFKPATAHSVEHLRDHFVKPIVQTSKPPSEWQDVASQPEVLIEGEGAEQTAKLTWATEPISLDQAKAKLERKVKDYKFSRMAGGVAVDVGGTTYIAQTDGQSRELIDNVYELAKADLLENGQVVRMLSNATPLLTQAQIIALKLSIGVMLCACTDAHTEREYAIDALPDDLQAHIDFDCTAGFPAFPEA